MIPRATAFAGVNPGGSCIDLRLLGFPKLPGRPLLLFAFAAELEFLGERHCNELPKYRLPV